MRSFVIVFCSFALCYAQNVSRSNISTVPLDLHNGLSEKIGNFSLELLYHTSKALSEQNIVMSPFTTWTVLTVIAEGAAGETLAQLNYALRLNRNRTVIRREFQNIAQWLQDNTSTVALERFNGIFADQHRLLERDFHDIAKRYYDLEVIPLDFSDGVKAANIINNGISQITHGRIPKLVESSYFDATQMILTSAIYFKGQWTSPFNASSTLKMPFYNSDGKEIGNVNMMYNRYTYPFSNIKELEARVIELPYGEQNRLSMLIMLPNPGVSLESMFLNFQKVPLDTVFKELRISQEEYGDDEVDCFLPRFKIESNLMLTNILKANFGIEDLFNQNSASLPHLARTPLYVTKIVHKAEIEVTEEGTTAAGVTSADFANRIGVVRFEANRPFSYMIVEKITNSIVFGGMYQKPSLY